MKNLRKYLFTGLFIVLPIALTYYIVMKLFTTVDDIFRGPIEKYFSVYLKVDHNLYGVGVIAVFLLLVVIGWAAQYYIGKQLLKLSEKLLDRIPIVNKILKMFRQISDAFFSGQKDVFKKAALIEYPRKGMWTIAFYTGECKGEVHEKAHQDLVSVFLPTTPNPTSGFLLMLPKSEVILLDMKIEDAFKLIVSCGVFTPENHENHTIITDNIEEKTE